MNEVPPIIVGASKAKKFFLLVIVFVFAAIIAGVVAFKYLLSIPDKSLIQADEGFKKAKITIDPEELRAWALAEIVKRQPVANDIEGNGIPNSEIPNYIKNLYSDFPEDAAVVKESGDSYVRIFWGGGFFHWVMEVGDTNFSEPFNSSNPEYPYNFEWVKGIYYTREANRKFQ